MIIYRDTEEGAKGQRKEAHFSTCLAYFFVSETGILNLISCTNTGSFKNNNACGIDGVSVHMNFHFITYAYTAPLVLSFLCFDLLGIDRREFLSSFLFWSSLISSAVCLEGHFVCSFLCLVP